MIFVICLFFLVWKNICFSNISYNQVTDADIPTELGDRLAEEKRMEQVRRKERNEAHLYMTINVLLEDSFDGHQGNDLYDPERALFRVFKIKKMATITEMLEMLADAFKYPPEQIRPWPFSQRLVEIFI